MDPKPLIPFSKPECSEFSDMPKLLVDDRERDSGIARLLRDRHQMSVAETRLTVGDYEIPQKLVVERKTVNDFALSVVDGRLFCQVTLLRKRTDNALLVLEGDLTKPPAVNLHPHALRGAILSVALDCDVPVIVTSGVEETAFTLWLLCRRYGALRRDVSLRPGRRPKQMNRRQLYLLQGLPGVGPLIARALLEQFGSVGRTLAASAEDLATVEGIGKIKAAKIREVLEAKAILSSAE